MAYLSTTLSLKCQQISLPKYSSPQTRHLRGLILSRRWVIIHYWHRLSTYYDHTSAHSTGAIASVPSCPCLTLAGVSGVRGSGTPHLTQPHPPYTHFPQAQSKFQEPRNAYNAAWSTAACEPFDPVHNDVSVAGACHPPRLIQLYSLFVFTVFNSSETHRYEQLYEDNH